MLKVDRVKNQLWTGIDGSLFVDRLPRMNGLERRREESSDSRDGEEGSIRDEKEVKGKNVFQVYMSWIMLRFLIFK